MSEEQASNAYRAALVYRRDLATPTANELRERLQPVVAAMSAGAWKSTATTAFEQELDDNRIALRNACDGTSDEFTSAVNNQPRTVSPGFWQTSWHRLG